ncbi:hypothetical protein ACIQTT_09400 [Microbacterium sp. NPDC090225]|uniref:hypothetical protein n=1 Tax=Microbacterium sp. NPDC090225 TaxID=3364207 RepID=UPI00382849C1
MSEAADTADACEAVYRAAQALEGELSVGAPAFYQDPESEEIRQSELEKSDNLPYFLLKSVSLSGRVLKFVVRTGRESDHDGLMSRGGASESMKQKAAVRQLRVWMVFPTAGDFAFMISETRGRGHAGELLLKWITRTLQRESVTINAKGKREEADWLHWKVEPRIDGSRLDGILQDSTDHSLRLKRRGVSSTGERGSLELELVQFGLKQTPIEKIAEAISKMAARRDSGSRAQREVEAAKDVVELVDSDVGGLDFNDGEISFKENGKVQTINAETVDRLFVYPLGGKRPKADAIFGAGSLVVEKIAPTLGVQLT